MILKNISKQIKISKGGKPYASVAIQLEEYKDGKGNMKWISGFGNKRTWAWKKGDDVQPDITENGQYLNFSFDDTNEDKLDVYRLPATVGLVLELMKGNKPIPAQNTQATAPAKEEAPAEEVAPEDIPF